MNRKWPIPIRIKRKNLKDEISAKLMKASILLNESGQTKAVQVGHVEMNSTQIAENVVAICNYIGDHLPSGWDNIRSLHIKTARSIALPIYKSLASKNDVANPVLKSLRVQKPPVRDELSILGRDVIVYPDGRVKVLHNEGDESSEESEDEEDAIITKNSKLKRKMTSGSTKKRSKNIRQKDDELNNEGGMIEDNVEMKYLLQMEMETAEKNELKKTKTEESLTENKTLRKKKEKRAETRIMNEAKKSPRKKSSTKL